MFSKGQRDCAIASRHQAPGASHTRHRSIESRDNEARKSWAHGVDLGRLRRMRRLRHSVLCGLRPFVRGGVTTLPACSPELACLRPPPYQSAQENIISFAVARARSPACRSPRHRRHPSLPRLPARYHARRQHQSAASGPTPRFLCLTSSAQLPQLPPISQFGSSSRCHSSLCRLQTNQHNQLIAVKSASSSSHPLSVVDPERLRTTPDLPTHERVVVSCGRRASGVACVRVCGEWYLHRVIGDETP